MRPLLSTVLLVSLTAVLLAGCIQEPEGAIAVYVKDAPVDDLESLFVTFGDVRVHRAGAEPDAEDPEGPGWIVLAQETQEYDLLRFTSDEARALLAHQGLIVGRYDQVLIQVLSARGILNETGEEVDVTVTQEELRLVRRFNVTAEDTTQIIIDLDLERSLTRQGESSYRLKPVIGSVQVDESSAKLQRSVPDRGVPRDGDGASG